MSLSSYPAIGNRRSAIGNARGSALVAAVLVMGLLVALAAAMAVEVRQRGRDSRAQVASLQARYLAQAGVRLAEATLQQDDTEVDSLEEEWALLGDGGQKVQVLGSGWLRVQVIDAGARVNINTATQETLLRLPGVDESLADAILDWREAGDTPRPSGAKADYYQALPEPYLPREAPFETVAEMLLVRGMTPTLLYGPPQPPGEGTESLDTDAEVLPLSEWVTVLSQERNVSAGGEARVDLSTAAAAQLVEASGGALTPQQAEAIVQYRAGGGSFASVGDLLSVPGLGQQQVGALADRVATTAEPMVSGRVNVNTAPLRVLETVPGITPEAASAIVAAREADRGPFRSIGDLLGQGPSGAPGEALLEAQAFRQAAGHLCTRSAAFLVRAMGRMPKDSVVVAVEAVVERTPEGTRVVRWAEVERAPGWIAWGWTRQVADPDAGEAVRW